MLNVRWMALGALALVAAASVAVALGGEAGPVTVPLSKCFECHASDPGSPLRAMAQLIPPSKPAGAAVGESFQFAVTVQNVWESEFRFTQPVLDISGAPSLLFSSDVGELVNSTSLDIRFGSNDPTQPVPALTSFTLPPGASSVTLTIKPQDTNPATGPDLELLITQVGNPTPIAKDDEGPGVPESFSVSGAEAAPYSGGTIQVGAQATKVDTGETPPRVIVADTVSFTVELRASFDFAGLTQLAIPLSQVVPQHLSTQVAWPLKVVAPPGEGETARLWVNTTAYYKHSRTETDAQPNWGNFSEPSEGTEFVPIVVEVVQDGDRVVLRPQETVIVRPTLQNGATIITISEAVGYASAFLLISSIWSGGMFGKASRRQLNSVFGSAKRRVAFHNFLSYGILLAATIHTVIFLFDVFEPLYPFTLGIIWGGLALLAFFGLGVTGALQVPMIRRWSYATWRWTHYGLTVASIVFTITHGLLDGVHFSDFQEFIGWKDPLAPLFDA